MRLLVSLPIALAAGLGASFALFHGSMPHSDAVPEAQRAEHERLSAGAGRPDIATATEVKTGRLLAAAFRKGNRNERDNALYLAIAALTAEDFDHVVTGAGALKALAEKLRGLENETLKDLASALIARGLTLDSAMLGKWVPRLLESLPVENDARRALLAALASKLPEEMLGLAMGRTDATERQPLVYHALEELAAQNTFKARAWLDLIKDPAERFEAERAVRYGTVRAEPLRAVELAGSSLILVGAEARALLGTAVERAVKMGPGVLRQLATMPMPPWMFSCVFDEFAEHDPEAALDFVLTSGPDENPKNCAIPFSVLARRDPAQAIAKMDGLTGKTLTTAISAIGGAWAASEPAAALSWMSAQLTSPGADLRHWKGEGQDALLNAFFDWAKNGKEEARAWADALPVGPMREAVQTQFAFALSQRGEAAEGAQSLALVGLGSHPTTLKAIASAWAAQDPLAAGDWMVAQPAGPAQDGALAAIVSAWANEDPRGAGEWLAQFPPGEARDRSVVAFLSRESVWAAGSAVRAAEFNTWFERIDDPWRRAKAAVWSFNGRKERDPAGARAWLSGLSNVDAEVIRIALIDRKPPPLDFRGN